jgi:hypothetical protein
MHVIYCQSPLFRCTSAGVPVAWAAGDVYDRGRGLCMPPCHGFFPFLRRASRKRAAATRYAGQGVRGSPELLRLGSTGCFLLNRRPSHTYAAALLAAIRLQGPCSRTAASSEPVVPV